MAMLLGLCSFFFPGFGNALILCQPPNEVPAKLSVASTRFNEVGNVVVELELSLEPGWFTWANPVGNKDYEYTRTTIKVTSAKVTNEVKSVFPKGEPLEFPGENTVYVYKDKVLIQVELSPPQSEEQKVSIAANLRLFTMAKSLPPQQLIVSVLLRPLAKKKANAKGTHLFD